jgi:hypothetical protein
MGVSVFPTTQCLPLWVSVIPGAENIGAGNFKPENPNFSLRFQIGPGGNATGVHILNAGQLHALAQRRKYRL